MVFGLTYIGFIANTTINTVHDISLVLFAYFIFHLVQFPSHFMDAEWPANQTKSVYHVQGVEMSVTSEHQRLYWIKWNTLYLYNLLGSKFRFKGFFQKLFKKVVKSCCCQISNKIHSVPFKNTTLLRNSLLEHAVYQKISSDCLLHKMTRFHWKLVPTFESSSHEQCCLLVLLIERWLRSSSVKSVDDSWVSTLAPVIIA